MIDGVHHYDENGLRDIAAEPPQIQKIHHEMIDFVVEWLKDFENGLRGPHDKISPFCVPHGGCSERTLDTNLVVDW